MAEFITVKVPFSQSTRAVGPIGHDGENVVRRVLFDCREVLQNRPDASIVCVIQRPDDSAPYIAPLEKTDEDGVYSLTIREVDVEKNGLVKMELRRIDGESVLKSDIITGVVKESITAEPAEPGDPEGDMLTELAKAAANAQGMADYIQEKLNNGEFTGATGATGEKGDKGDTGAQGPQGEKGDKGDAGDLITDTVTGSTFRFAMENGYLYFEEVSAT